MRRDPSQGRSNAGPEPSDTLGQPGPAQPMVTRRRRAAGASSHRPARGYEPRDARHSGKERARVYTQYKYKYKYTYTQVHHRAGLSHPPVLVLSCPSRMGLKPCGFQARVSSPSLLREDRIPGGVHACAFRQWLEGREPGRRRWTGLVSLPCCPLGKSSRGVRWERGLCCCALSESQVCDPSLIRGPCPSWRWRVVIVSRCHKALCMFCQLVRNGPCACSRTLGRRRRQHKSTGPGGRRMLCGLMVCNRGPLCRKPDSNILSRQVRRAHATCLPGQPASSHPKRGGPRLLSL